MPFISPTRKSEGAFDALLDHRKPLTTRFTMALGLSSSDAGKTGRLLDLRRGVEGKYGLSLSQIYTCSLMSKDMSSYIRAPRGEFKLGTIKSDLVKFVDAIYAIVIT